MATLSSVLGQIRQNESGGNYTAQNPNSTASGAYQFVNGTWQSLTRQSGIGTQYATAGSAPPAVQDAVAAYALGNNPNANSCSLWGTCNAAGQVTGPARYPIVDTYDVTPQQLAGTLAEGPVDGSTGNNTIAGPGALGGGYVSPDGSYVPPQAIPGVTPNPNQPAYVSSTTGQGYGYPLTLGFQSGILNAINQWISGIETAVGTAFKNAAGTLLGEVENLSLRFGLIVVAIILVAIALWRLMDPDGSKAEAIVKTAAAA